MATTIAPRTEKEAELVRKAKVTADLLDKYDLAQEAIFMDLLL